MILMFYQIELSRYKRRFLRNLQPLLALFKKSSNEITEEVKYKLNDLKKIFFILFEPLILT